MSEVADFFQCKINYIGDNLIIVRVSANSKHLNYLAFVKGLNYLGRRLTNKEIIEVQIIKNSMNNKRVYFNWDHLNKFYT